VLALKVAVTVSVPEGRAVVEIEALPLDKVAEPRVVEPYVKLTVPVGVTPLAVTVAVSVTADPLVEGFFDDTMLVVVVAACTT
jgi:hypothetical protein